MFDLIPAVPVSGTGIALILALAATLWIVNTLFIHPYFSSIHDVPGPPSFSLFFGNLGRIFKEEPGRPHREWSATYGPAVQYKAMFGERRLFFTDPVALNHILLTHAYDYPKPSEVRGNLSRILGKGILFAEGEDHRRQKRILTPAFSPSALRDLTPIFFDLSYKLRERWLELINTDSVDQRGFKDAASLQAYKDGRTDKGEIVIEVSKWLSRVTLDIIGLAAFGYSFNSMDQQANRLADAFSSMFSSSVKSPTPFTLLFQRTVTKLPFFQYLPNRRIQSVRAGFTAMDEETRKIVDQKRKEIAADGVGSASGGKDIISLLLRANSADAKNQMSQAELQGQMTTFVLAGHETTSTSLTWTLWTLAKHPEVQQKLREELRTARAKATEEGREELGSDELNSLEYLDAVCREVLRFESPVSLTIRQSAKDDLIPLSAPIKGKSGNLISAVRVKAGQVIAISISSANFNKVIFGEDAELFRPERWLEGHVGEKVSGCGVYSNMLTFLAGPRACIGYKFSLLELKAILSVLIDTFAFAEREPGLPITRRSVLVSRSLVVGEEEALGYAMPLRVSVAKRDG